MDIAKPSRYISHFYPRSPCGERLSMAAFCQVVSAISIHALLAESDVSSFGMSSFVTRFLSTLSLRRATWQSARRGLAPGDFYPRSPCGERPDGSTTINLFEQFLSTLSLRRATLPRCPMLSPQAISIHALLAESDPYFCSFTS